MSLASSYDPKQFEARLYEQWESSGVFQPRGEGQSYTILLPPPNVTGTLHMGHAFQHTLQDALIRYHRMRGYRTLWQMGTDHAGIATEMVVGRNLAIEGKGETRDSLGRDKFIEKVWDWKQQSGGTIERQMRRLGASGDWSRSVFTMDPMASDAITEAFVRLHEKGLIYRGQRLVNWDPVLKTAISDLEVANEEENGHMWSIRYPLADGASYEYVERDADGNETLREIRDYVVVATTRPETMLGDTAVMVHPEDERYIAIHGKFVDLPLTGRRIPVITDSYVDRAFGTGVVKVTPAHDFNDYAVGQRHSLLSINIFAPDASVWTLSGPTALKHVLSSAAPDFTKIDRDACTPQQNQYADDFSLFAEQGMAAIVEKYIPATYRGLDRFEARKMIVADLDVAELLIEIKPHRLQVPRGDRSGQVIEPYLTDQWFVKMDALAQRGLELVESGEVKFVPANWINTYRHWLENIQDWTISRQLWWGHRIPAWTVRSGESDFTPLIGEIVARTEADAEVAARAKLLGSLGRENYDKIKDRIELAQDPDVLETWFSSAMFPFSTQGWPNEDKMGELGFDIALPTSVLVTGFDIIFFWVARMIMMTDELVGRVPFRDVYITGLVRDKDGQKMSKSKGNILDPLDIIDGITAEALVAKRTTGLMKPQDAPKIEKATRKEFPDGIPAFGADALRFTMTALAGPGRDIKFDLGRAEGYKNFCNKLWNATRFVLMNTEDADFTGAPQPKTDAERWILAQLAKAAAEAETHFAAYRFDLLAQTLYEFAWNAFCDWFVELAKPALQGDDATAADSTRHTLLYVLERLLSLLHPLIPFVTEELWQQVAPKLGIAETTVMLRPYPQAGDLSADYAQAEADVEWLKGMVSALRKVRSELNVSPQKNVGLLLAKGDAADRDRAARFDSQLRFLNRLESIEFVADANDAPPAASAVVGELTLLVPLEGLVDLGAERTRLDKEIKRVAGEIGKCQGKLASETFVQNAPAAVVEQERKRLVDWNVQLEGLTAQRTKLG
ncbi:valine--tRNA ligase [Lysobacter antibioticus]|uniref:Valine--tRNA ligase n=1 Tax=Lysobacter antibioticus TaxID=84531 RepID=A0A0S2F6U5_LYSAN|nr:valine--tRNA ligase [Lysobacter antibioticus]ALN79270.1 valine--tRNA ligase [Lysobacter antibioticus]